MLYVTLPDGQYWGRCRECGSLMVKTVNDDTNHPNICGQDCYDDYCERPRGMGADDVAYFGG